MKTIYALILAIAAIAISPLQGGAKDIMTVEYKDSITNSLLRFPEGSYLFPKEKDYQQWVKLPNGNEVEVLSFKNEKDEPYAWSEIARVEEELPFSSLHSQLRIDPSYGIDAWQRIYHLQDKKGKPYSVIVTEVRGNDNALVLFEYNMGPTFDMWSHSILYASDVPRFTKVLREADSKWWQWVIVLGIGFSCLLFRPQLDKIKGWGAFLTSLAMGAATWFVFYYFTLLPVGTVWIFAAIVALLWIFCSLSDDNESFFTRLGSTIVDNLS